MFKGHNAGSRNTQRVKTAKCTLNIYAFCPLLVYVLRFTLYTHRRRVRLITGSTADRPRAAVTAQRLEPGDGARRRLVDTGCLPSRLAVTRPVVAARRVSSLGRRATVVRRR